MGNASAKPMWLNRRERVFDVRAQPMVSLAAAGLLGILSDRAGPLTLASGLVATSLVTAIGVTLWSQPSARQRMNWALALILTAIAGAIHARTERHSFQSSSLATVITDERQPILLRAVVRGDVQRRPSRRPNYDRPPQRPVDVPPGTVVGVPVQWETRFVADVTEVRYGRDWTAFAGGIYVVVLDDCSSLGIGDHVELGGDIRGFGAPSNPGESDYRTVARNRRYHGRLFVNGIQHLKLLRAGPWSIARLADTLGRSGERTLQSCLSETTAPIASALVVGRRAGLENDTRNKLLETGTIHLLSVSGLHLGIVAGVMITFGVIAGLGKRSLVLLVGAVCFAFAAITGANPPVMRAAILVATMLMALMINRRPWPLNTLAFAALVLMWLNPTNVEQVGVQLSFISVATLIACARAIDPASQHIADDESSEAKIEGLIDTKRSWQARWLRRRAIGLRQVLWLSLCITLTTVPLTWLNFHVVSPIAILTNLVLGLPAAIALIAGIFAVMVGWIWQPIAIIPGMVCEAALRAMVAVVDVASAIPLGHFWLPSPPAWWVTIYYVTVIAICTTSYVVKKKLAFYSWSLIWCAVAYALAVSPQWRTRDSLDAIFIDVGHGTSVLLEMPTGENYLYDSGRLGNDDLTSRGIEDVLWSRGLTRLDAVILSHADADHYNALPGLVHRFGIGEVVTPPGLFDDDSVILAEIHAELERYGIPVREVSVADGFMHPDRAIQILHPPMARLPGSDNANSLVIRIDFQGRSLTLPGDLEPPGTRTVVNLPRPIPGGVMMAPHHGSLSAKTKEMLQWARPSMVVVSGGDRAKNPAVIKMLQAYGSEVAVTARDGAIRVVINGGGIELRGFLKSPF